MSAPRRPLRGLYDGTQPPTRGASLAGRLGAVTGAPEIDKPGDEPAAEVASAPPASRRLSEPGRRRGGAPRKVAPAASGTRLVTVALDTSVREDLRAYAARSGLTQATVALRAVQAHQPELEVHWRHESRLATGDLFQGAAAAPRVGPARSTAQMKLAVTDVDTLDGLVETWCAPSRSALINEALCRFLPHRKESQ